MSEIDEIRLRQESIDALNEVLSAVIEQDKRHPAGFPPTRDGVRLGIAAASDELSEAWEAWHVYKLTSNWFPCRAELIDCAANVIRTIREIKA